jgi:hypothetical protein
MRLRALFVALVLLGALPAAAAERAPTSSSIMHSMGLDQLFAQFGRNMALSPRRQGVTDERFLDAWESVASDAFARSELNARLRTTLSRGLEPAELARIEDFLRSPFGSRVTQLEQAVQALPAERQIAAVAKGQTLYLSTSETRRELFEELLDLSGAEVTFAMLGESIRGMAVGLHLVSKGDLDIPWEEIDAGVQRQLAGMRQSLAEAIRGTVALTYDELSDAELEAYVEFLRSPATRKFYAVTSVTIGAVIRETMFTLGEDVALRLQRVDI